MAKEFRDFEIEEFFNEELARTSRRLGAEHLEFICSALFERSLRVSQGAKKTLAVRACELLRYSDSMFRYSRS